MPSDEPNARGHRRAGSTKSGDDLPLGPGRDRRAASRRRCDAERACAEARAATARTADLGAFAAGRIDVDRFAAVAARESVGVEPAATERVAAGLDVLQLAPRAAGRRSATVDGGAGRQPRATPSSVALGRRRAGLRRRARRRAVAAAGVYKEAEHGGLARALPVRGRGTAGSAASRRRSCVRVDGADLPRRTAWPTSSTVTQKIVLVVRGDARRPRRWRASSRPACSSCRRRTPTDLARFDGVGRARRSRRSSPTARPPSSTTPTAGRTSGTVCRSSTCPRSGPRRPSAASARSS